MDSKIQDGCGDNKSYYDSLISSHGAMVFNGLKLFSRGCDIPHPDPHINRDLECSEMKKKP